MSKYKRNHPLNQIYNRILAMALIIIALVIINLLATVTAHQAMRRESDRPIPVKAEIVLSLDQALNLSLAYGDYRRVNVDWAEVA